MKKIIITAITFLICTAACDPKVVYLDPPPHFPPVTPQRVSANSCVLKASSYLIKNTFQYGTCGVSSGKIINVDEDGKYIPDETFEGECVFGSGNFSNSCIDYVERDCVVDINVNNLHVKKHTLTVGKIAWSFGGTKAEGDLQITKKRYDMDSGEEETCTGVYKFEATRL